METLNLFKKLQRRTEKAQLRMQKGGNKKKYSKSAETRAHEFLLELPKKLLKIADRGVNNAEILRINNPKKLTEFEKLVFEGCKAQLGLPVVIKELFFAPDADFPQKKKESMGHFIYLRWEK